tara:strand:- start:2811 stop:4268 length:1458 start_codon:yes stop_codon:yes gene_type:complete
MIHESTLEAVYPLAEKLAKKGIKVTPLQTTPVEQLCQAGHYPIPTRGIDNLPEVEERILKGSAAKDPMGGCRHDIVMDEMVDVIAETVRNNLDLARNTINPIVKDVAQEVEEYLQDAESVHKTHVSVVPVNYKAIWNSPVLSEMVARYSETALREVNLRVGIPYEVDRDELLELAKTGASRFDQEVEEFFAQLSDDTIVSTWYAIFGADPAGRARVLNDVIRSGSVLSNRDGIDRALLTHLFCRKLIQDPPEGVKMGLEEYRAYIADILSQSGRVINSIMKRREANIQRRQLVEIWPMSREMLGKELIEIRVNGDVYGRWLEQGGEPDAIIGSFVTDQERSYTALLDGVVRYAKEWERQARVLGTTQRLNRFNHAVDGMRLAIARQINELDEERLVVSREILHRRLEENLSNLYGDFYNNIFVYARKMVCDTIFPHTLGLKILCAIDNVANDYPDIDVREAALLATIEIVSLWVAKLCKVDRVAV